LAWLNGRTEAPPLVGRPFLLATACSGELGRKPFTDFLVADHDALIADEQIVRLGGGDRRDLGYEKECMRQADQARTNFAGSNPILRSFRSSLRDFRRAGS
jgi:hypothetical protein